MKKQEVRQKLSEFVNGGNAFMLYDFLLEKKVSEIQISQNDLAKELNKTRPAIQASLKILEEIGVIKCSYGKIKIK